MMKSLLDGCLLNISYSYTSGSEIHNNNKSLLLSLPTSLPDNLLTNQTAFSHVVVWSIRKLDNSQTGRFVGLVNSPTATSHL